MAGRRGSALLAEARRRDELAVSEPARRLALLGTFDAQRSAASEEEEQVRALFCLPLPTRGGRREAMMTDARRIEALAAILRSGGRSELQRVRATVQSELDTPLQRMLDAFVRDRDVPVGERDEDELIASLDVYHWATEAVARAGLTTKIPVEPGRDAIESRLALLDVTRPVRRLVAEGCVGREAELEQLHAYRNAKPGGSGLAGEPAMVVYGIGGVGKSTLVAQFVVDLFEEDDSTAQPWAYLDFDRPTLASYAPDVVLADIIRQVAAQLHEHRRALERSEDVEAQLDIGAGLEARDERSYLARAAAFARALESIGNQALLVVLDTFEEVEREASPEQLEALHRLFAVLSSELPGLKLVVSGRSPAAAFDSPPERGRRLAVLPLDDDAAGVLLRHLVVTEAARSSRSEPVLDDDLAREVVGLVGGIPLTLRLAARVLVQEGAEAVADAAARAGALERVRAEFVRGFLYHRILNHITADDPVETMALRRVAMASIALRWVNEELVGEVLLPVLGSVDGFSAAHLYDALARDVAFADSDGQLLRLREDLRGPALAALEISDRALVQRVHARAAAYFAAQPRDERNLMELAYHRLAAGETVAAVSADVGEEILRRLGPAPADLPQAAAAEIGRVQRDSGAVARSSDLLAWERSVLPEAEAALQRGDLKGARALLGQRSRRSPGTELHRLESRLLEAEGKSRAAAVAARRDLHASAAAAAPVRYAAAAVRLAGLHEADGRPQEADAALRDAVDAPLLSAFPALRLELLLNRMAMQERVGLDSEDSRWTLGLDARALLQAVDSREVASSTALLRLLAAALGREEPKRVRTAVRSVGFGRGEDPRRVEDVVRAIAAWDAQPPEPRRLATALGVEVDDAGPEPLTRAWRARLVGMGTDAGPLLDRLWELESPPETVREALRAVYVWWGVRRPPPPGPAPARHFLAEPTLDWSRDETLTLEELVLTAYPTSSEALALADRAGLDVERIQTASSDRGIARDLLTLASRSGRLDELVAAMLEDKAAVSVHEPLRKLVGKDWLDSLL